MIAPFLLLAGASVLAAPGTHGDAAQNAASRKSRVLVLDLGGDVDTEARRSITALVTTKLSRRGLDVVSGEDLRRMAALEAEKQEAGCVDESCLAELAGALDARLVVSGFVGRLGDLYVVNLSLFDAKAARAHGRATVEASTIEAIATKLDPAIDEMVAEFLPRAGPGMVPLAVTGAGLTAFGVGASCGAVALALSLAVDDARRELLDDSARFERRGDPDLIRDLADGHAAFETARQSWNTFGVPLTWAGVVLSTTGVIMLATGAVLLLAPEEEP